MRPFSGKIIEMFGKRKTLLISQFFFCLSSILYIFIDSLSLLLTLRLFHGIWFSLVTTVLVAIVNDIIPESRKGTGLGYFAMAMNLGVVFGPLIALTALQWFSYQALYICSSYYHHHWLFICIYIESFRIPASTFNCETSSSLMA